MLKLKTLVLLSCCLAYPTVSSSANKMKLIIMSEGNPNKQTTCEFVKFSHTPPDKNAKLILRDSCFDLLTQNTTPPPTQLPRCWKDPKRGIFKCKTADGTNTQVVDSIDIQYAPSRKGTLKFDTIHSIRYRHTEIIGRVSYGRTNNGENRTNIKISVSTTPGKMNTTSTCIRSSSSSQISIGDLNSQDIKDLPDRYKRRLCSIPKNKIFYVNIKATDPACGTTKKCRVKINNTNLKTTK